MSSTSISVAASVAMLSGPGLLPWLDAQAAPAYVDVFGGTQPSPGGSGGGPLVCTMPLQRPPGTMSGGSLVLAVPTSGAVAIASASPKWARVYDGAGTRAFDIKARLSTDTDDPADPAALVVLASVVEAGSLLRFTAGAIGLSG